MDVTVPSPDPTPPPRSGEVVAFLPGSPTDGASGEGATRLNASLTAAARAKYASTTGWICLAPAGSAGAAVPPREDAAATAAAAAICG